MTIHAKHQTISLEDDLTFIDSLFDENNAKFTNSIMLHGFFYGTSLFSYIDNA